MSYKWCMCLSITLRCPVSEMALLVLMEYGKDVHSLCVYYVHLVCTSLLRKVLCQQHVTWLSLVVCVCVLWKMWIFSTPTPLLLVPWLWYWCWVEMWCYGESQVYVNGKVWDLPSMWIDCSHHYHFWHTYTSLTLLALLIHSVPVQCTQHKTIGMVQSTASMHAQLPNPINTSAAAAHPIPVCPHLHSGSSTQSSAFYCCCCILVRHTHSY